MWRGYYEKEIIDTLVRHGKTRSSDLLKLINEKRKNSKQKNMMSSKTLDKYVTSLAKKGIIRKRVERHKCVWLETTENTEIELELLNIVENLNFLFTLNKTNTANVKFVHRKKGQKEFHFTTTENLPSKSDDVAYIKTEKQNTTTKFTIFNPKIGRITITHEPYEFSDLATSMLKMLATDEAEKGVKP